MIIKGTAKKLGGKYYFVDMPALDAVTQGRSRKEVLVMAVDWVRCMLDDDVFPATARWTSDTEFELSSPCDAKLLSLMLKQKRQAARMSAQQAADKIGATSVAGYYRYERGTVMPSQRTLAKLCALVGVSVNVRLG